MVPLRRWQKDALKAWRRNRSGIVSATTGAGKTIFAQACMEEFLGTQPDGRIAILVPTIALLDQWVVSLVEDLKVHPDQVTAYSGDSKPEQPSRYSVYVFNTARDLLPQHAVAKPTMVIVDECHRIASEQNMRALRSKFAATLGVSATPERQYDTLFELALVPVLGEIIYRYELAEAVADGVLSRFELVNVRIDLMESEQRLYDALTVNIARQAGTNADVQDSLVFKRAAILAGAKTRIPIATSIAEQHKSERKIIFHERIADATELQGILTHRGHLATIYHSQLGPALRRDNLRLFKLKVFDTLVTCRALDEGLNVPDIGVAIIASSTRSRRQRIQRLGRVLRPAPGKSIASIFTLYATDEEEEALRSEVETIEEADSVRWMKAAVGRGTNTD